MIFAQVTTPNSTYDFISNVALAASIAGNIFLVFSINRTQKREIGPDPLRVQEAERFVTREHCELAHRLIEEQVKECKQSIERQDEKRRTDISVIFEKINKIDKEVGALGADVRTALAQINRVDDKIER